jgi:hypothetical protein
MKITDIITEDFNGEYDDEAGMAKTNLHTIARAAQGLLDTIDDQENLPEWVQEKIAKVEGMMVTAWDYLRSQEEQGIDPQMMEAANAAQQAAIAINMKKHHKKPKNEDVELAEEFDLIESIIERLAEHNGVDAEVIWEDLETLTEDELYAFAVTSEPIMESQGVAEGSLNEFAPSGNSASSYYAVTENFVNEFTQQKQEELQDLIDAGWTKQDLAQAGTLAGQAADIVHLEQVRDGFLKGLKSGFNAYLQGDTQLKDQLGAYWIDNNLPLSQDWEKIYGEPWGDDSEFDEGMAEDWQKANKRDKTDGMSQKAVNAYRRENPGSKLKTAVTTKPSKLKKGGKASKRRKSYCSRSRGQMKMHSISCAKTPDKAICKARRRWNC